MPSTDDQYEERLSIPIIWWLMVLTFAGSLVVAVWAYLGMGWGLATALATVVLAALVFVPWGRTPVRIDDRGVTAGIAVLEWPYVGAAEALDADAAARALGPQANAAAYFLTRSYTRGAVRIDVEDAADPHPYWLISTRHPQRVAELVNARREA